MTLVEIIVVIAIIGTLVAALFPSYTGYIQRGRDVTRITHIDQLLKAHSSFFNDNNKYPDHYSSGCVNKIAIDKYTDFKTIEDPLPGHSNGCDIVRYYGYASGSFAFNMDTYSLVAIMEQPQGGNYGGDLTGFTGTLTNLAYNSGANSTIIYKGAGQYYVRIP